MKLGKMTMEVEPADVARKWASDNRCAFISWSLMEDLLKIPEVNERCVFVPETVTYRRNLEYYQAQEKEPVDGAHDQRRR